MTEDRRQLCVLKEERREKKRFSSVFHFQRMNYHLFNVSQHLIRLLSVSSILCYAFFLQFASFKLEIKAAAILSILEEGCSQ